MGDWVDAGAADGLERDDVVAWRHGGREFALYRTGDDRYYASDLRCTHQGTPLCDGLVLDGVIECPKHNGRFELATGRALGAPVLADLAMYPTRVEGGRLLVDVGEGGGPTSSGGPAG